MSTGESRDAPDDGLRELKAHEREFDPDEATEKLCDALGDLFEAFSGALHAVFPEARPLMQEGVPTLRAFGFAYVMQADARIRRHRETMRFPPLQGSKRQQRATVVQWLTQPDVLRLIPESDHRALLANPTHAREVIIKADEDNHAKFLQELRTPPAE